LKTRIRNLLALAFSKAAERESKASNSSQAFAETRVEAAQYRNALVFTEQRLSRKHATPKNGQSEFQQDATDSVVKPFAYPPAKQNDKLTESLTFIEADSQSQQTLRFDSPQPAKQHRDDVLVYPHAVNAKRNSLKIPSSPDSARPDERAPISSEAEEACWPSLPSSPEFELVDELQTMKRESEALDRLEREQRGTLWNA
jgi:hypothetical protein